MFTLHETTRRTLCRAAFWLLCAGPTLCASAFVLWIRSDAFTRYQCRRLEACLGLKAAVGRASQPRPGILLLERVTLAKRDKTRVLVACEKLELREHDSAIEIFAPEATLSFAGLQDLWTAAERTSGDDSRCVRLTLGRLKLSGGPDKKTYELTEIAAKLDLSADGKPPKATAINTVAGSPTEARQSPEAPVWTPRGWVRFRCGHTMEERPAELVVGRVDYPSRHESVLLFDSGDASAPAGLFAQHAVWIRRFGADCQILGRAMIALGDDGASFGVDPAAGLRLGNVSLSSLLASTPSDTAANENNQLSGLQPRGPRRLTGKAEIAIERLDVTAGRIQVLEGSLAAASGEIDPRLLEAATRELACIPGVEASRLSNGRIAYRDLAFWFRLDRLGIEVRQERESMRPGVLVVSSEGPLLTSPQGIQPASGIVRMLGGDNAIELPASDDSLRLAGLLPLIARPARVAQTSPNAP